MSNVLPPVPVSPSLHQPPWLGELGNNVAWSSDSLTGDQATKLGTRQAHAQFLQHREEDAVLASQEWHSRLHMCVTVSFLPPWYDLYSSGRREPRLRTCIYQIVAEESLKGYFLNL